MKLVMALAVLALLVVGAWSLAGLRRRQQRDEFQVLWDSDRGRASLFVEVQEATQSALLEEWRWKVGPDARFFKVTVFGDLFLKTSGGSVFLLDTGRGSYEEVASSEGGWEKAARQIGASWFHWPTLAKLRAAGRRLPDGNVYSWRHSLRLGGTDSESNVDVVELIVHVAFAAQIAKSTDGLPAGQRIDRIEFQALGPGGVVPEGDALFQVVTNAEEQYSIWPAGADLPATWKSVGKEGTQEECLVYIEEVWTDMRPLSEREK